jgi:hypothetical protein
MCKFQMPESYEILQSFGLENLQYFIRFLYAPLFILLWTSINCSHKKFYNIGRAQVRQKSTLLEDFLVADFYFNAYKLKAH